MYYNKILVYYTGLIIINNINIFIIDIVEIKAAILKNNKNPSASSRLQKGLLCRYTYYLN